MYKKAYLDYLVQFHGTRDYFECHEILEEYWKTEKPIDKNSLWVGFIQFAVSMYHYRRNNFTGASRTLQKAISIIESKQMNLDKLGINKDEFLLLLKQIENKITKKEAYQSVNIPLSDQTLKKLVEERCTQIGCPYGMPSNTMDEQLVNRHMLRDRSEVVKERLHQLSLRKK